MWKKLVVAAALLAVLGSPGVLAQPAPDRPNGAFSREDAGAFLEARIAALHAGLQLTPEQERLWPPFEQAFRDRGKLRIARMAAGAPPATEDPIARLQRRADALLQQGAMLKRLAETAAPLWQSFDEAQKRRFAVLARPFNRRAALGFGGGRFDERSGPGVAPGREGGRFGFDGGPRGVGPGTIPGMRPRFGFRGPLVRDGDDFGYGRGPRGREGGFGGDQRGDSDRIGRGLFR